ncbi:MAG TPA: hypothetical protein VGQ09_23610 [Chitinophagaceae bacterium]|nr:hypothetical protein [Chitinophagaceae bacterium]
MSYQILAAENFYEGHGISLTKITAEDISSPVYEPLFQWPPGFSLLFIPFYILFNKNYLPAAIAISLLSAIALIFFCRSILKILNIPHFLINLYTFITGFFIYYFYSKPCTDATAITFFVIGIYFTLLLLKTNKYYLKNSVCIIIALIICGTIKYLYMPVVFIIPLFLILKGFLAESPIIKKTGVISFLTLLFTFVLLLIFQKYTSDSLGYIKEVERGFFPENLLAAHPFLCASLVKPESMEVLFSPKPETAITIFHVFQLIHFLGILFLIIFTIKRLSVYRLKKNFPPDNFFYLFFFISLAINFLLIALSLWVSKEFVYTGRFWTYLEEPRYYGMINVLLHIGIFVIYQYSSLSKSYKLKLLFFFLIILLIPEIFRGAIFTVNRVLNFNKEIYGWQYEHKFQKFTAEMIKKLKTENLSTNIVLTGTSDWMTLRASLYVHLPIFEDPEKLNNLSLLKTNRPVLLLFIVREDQLGHFKPFLTLKTTRYLGNNNEFSFYANYIIPN